MHGNKVLGEAIHTQKESMMFGGILPPIAQESHRRHIEQVVSRSLKEANVSIIDVDAIAVTNRPGLNMSLTIGLRFAKHLSRTHKKPLIPIHHMEAHALTVRAENEEVKFPYLCLLVSGGHSLLAVVQDVDKFFLLGETIDDAPGEAFDKIARQLKLRNVPKFEKLSGGQSIEQAAKSCTEITDKYKFPLMLARSRDCQFSFSGLKNSAKRHIAIQQKTLNLNIDEVIPDYENFCANFLGAVTRHITNRTQRAIEYCQLKEIFKDVEHRSLVISGGVASNDFLFTALSEMSDQLGFKAIRPSKKLCTDNGIMIAWNGVERFRRQLDVHSYDSIDEIDTIPKCVLGEDIIDKVKEECIACDWIKPASLKVFMRPPK